MTALLKVSLLKAAFNASICLIDKENKNERGIKSRTRKIDGGSH